MAVASVIKYEGDNSTFIWKHPKEDFNSFSQLIVHESQEAIFFMDGQALDLFGPGRHTLETENIPKIGRALKRTTGRKPFHCEVYFINKTEQMAIKWGTDSKVEYMDPTYNFPLQIGACGEMSLRAEDSRKLLLKVVGTENDLTQQALTQKFRGFLMTRVKTYLAQLIKSEKINIFEIDEHLSSMSEALLHRLQPDFEDYGVALERFFVSTILKPEEDRSYQQFRELHFRQYADVAEARLRQQVGVIEQETAARRMKIEAEALATKRALEGYTYQQERSFDVAEEVARNEASGQMANLGIGMGVMAGVGGVVGSGVGGMMQTAMGAAAADTVERCSSCGAALPDGAKFCLECGEKVVSVPAGYMLCPRCGKATPIGKFCMDCGAPLAGKCPGCGAEVPAGGKFCPDCGHKL